MKNDDIAFEMLKKFEDKTEADESNARDQLSFYLEKFSKEYLTDRELNILSENIEI